MSDRAKLILIMIGCLVLFVGALAFLIIAFRDRLRRPLTDADFGDNGDDDEEDGETGDDGTDNSDAAEASDESEETDRSGGSDPPVSSFARPEAEESLSGQQAEEESLGEEDLESLFTELFEGKPQDSETDDSTSQDGSGVFYVEDILDCEKYLGRTPEECGAPAESVSSERSEILTEGQLFGAYAYGGIKLGAEEEIGVPITCGYYAISHEISYDDCKKNLRARFGKTISSGMQSFDEDDEEEGTVYCAFETPEGVLWLSHTGNCDYINLNFIP